VFCLATVVFSLDCELQVAGSSRHVSIEIWQGTLALESMGGNAVLLRAGPVSELGDPCCKNWTNAVVSFYLAGRRLLTLCTCRCGFI